MDNMANNDSIEPIDILQSLQQNGIPKAEEKIDTPEEVEEENKKDARLMEVEQILELMRRWHVRGVTRASEIQKLLKKNGFVRTKRSIYRYKKMLSEQMTDKVKQEIGAKKSIEELATELQETYREVLRELWTEYHRKEDLVVQCDHCKQKHTAKVPNSGNVKVSALRTIKDATKELVELMQSMGLVYKEPEKVKNLNIDVPITKEKLNQEFTAYIKAKWQDPVSEKKG